ncbi:nostrin-like isoform X3 [Lineus longissimus]|uniref:nostrin-like isoform X3 n=1 Tax=Lineus longissimus TaxID=88925 RepID=UPI00315CBA45
MMKGKKSSFDLTSSKPDPAAPTRPSLKRDLHVIDSKFEGLTGFDELRRYIKQGNEFCKEVALLMQERADVEATYAKSLTKISNKLQKQASNCLGSLAVAWLGVATSVEAEADLHRNLSSALVEDLHKPVKQLSEYIHKTRKPIEATVDKSMKNLMDKRNEEMRSKKSAFGCARDTEKVIDQTRDVKAGKGKFTDKDLARMEKKGKHSEDNLRKADKDYHDSCQKAEGARQEWESAVYKGTNQLQSLEEERISQLQDALNKYNNHISVMGPKLIKVCDNMGESVKTVDIQADLASVVDEKGSGQNQPEQILIECYAEDLGSPMDKERRIYALRTYLYYLEADIEREQKGREGVEKLLDVYRNKPNYGDTETQDDVKNKLAGLNATMNFLEAGKYKITSAMAAANGEPKPEYTFAQYIERTKDKQGLPQSILRVPPALRGETPGFRSTYNVPGSRPPAVGRQVDSMYDEDEFDNYDGDDFGADGADGHAAIGECQALYDYQGTQPDELTIHAGDIIRLEHKEGDGWWHGELNGQRGIFPATYVKEL